MKIAIIAHDGKKAEMVSFLMKHPHEPDIAMLMRICDVHDIPLATNPATARSLVGGIK